MRKKERENAYTQDNYLKIKGRYQIVVRLIAIKYYKEFLCCLSSYINF